MADKFKLKTCRFRATILQICSNVPSGGHAIFISGDLTANQPSRHLRRGWGSLVIVRLSALMLCLTYAQSLSAGGASDLLTIGRQVVDDSYPIYIGNGLCSSSVDCTKKAVAKISQDHGVVVFYFYEAREPQLISQITERCMTSFLSKNNVKGMKVHFLREAFKDVPFGLLMFQKDMLTITMER